jgi:hypothetical protein
MSYDMDTQDPGSASSVGKLNALQNIATVNVQEEYTKEVGEQLGKQWDKEMAKELGVSQDVTKDVAVPTPTTPAYFTEGEMLPWKGRWFRVSLLTLPDGQRVIGLVQVKATASSTKRAERELRWKRQHPHATAPRPGSQRPSTPLASSRAAA